MKLDSKENANVSHYDALNGKPAILEKDNDGSFLYRYDIEPETGVNPDGVETQSETGEISPETQSGWKCKEVRVWGEPTKANIKKAVIRSIIDETEEFSLVNAYNAHQMGVKDDPEAVDEYKDYLRLLARIDATITRDLSNL